MNVTVIGGNGLVGSAFVRLLRGERGLRLTVVTRSTYPERQAAPSDVVIDASGNSRKFVADESPREDLRLTVDHRLRTILDFPAKLHVHVSSVDVYPDLASPATTTEDADLDAPGASHYGFHKRLAEEVVRHYASEWLIVRLAGMVGPGLRKNPVYDILEGRPLRIHPESRYQFLHTDDMARIVWTLVRHGERAHAVNVCGDGLVTPREVAQMAGRALDLSAVPEGARPRVVEASLERLRGLVSPPDTVETVRAFVRGWPESGRASA